MSTIQDILLPYQRKFITNPARRKIWISGRQLGKSTSLACLMCYKALSHVNGLSLCISTGARAASEIIRKVVQFADAIKLLSKNQITYTACFDSVKFSNGSRVLSLPSSDDGANLRGFSANCVCIDEAAFIRNLEPQINAIAPTLTRDPNSELILATTPAGTSGFFYDLYQQALESPEWYVQTTTIQNAIEDGLKVDIDALHTLCPDPDVFAQEYECKFIKGASEFIDPDLLQFSSVIPTNGAEYLGIDIGRNHDHSVIVKIVVKDGKIYVQNIITLEKTPFVEQQQIILKTAAQAKNFQYGFIDATGIGNPVAEYCNTSNKKLAPFTFTGANKSGLYEFLRAKIFENNIQFASEFKEALITDIRNIQRITDGNNVKFAATHTANGHADIISALVLALHAYRTHLPSIAMPLPYKPFSRFS